MNGSDTRLRELCHHLSQIVDLALKTRHEVRLRLGRANDLGRGWRRITWTCSFRARRAGSRERGVKEIFRWGLISGLGPRANSFSHTAGPRRMPATFLRASSLAIDGLSRALLSQFLSSIFDQGIFVPRRSGHGLTVGRHSVVCLGCSRIGQTGFQWLQGNWLILFQFLNEIVVILMPSHGRGAVSLLQVLLHSGMSLGIRAMSGLRRRSRLCMVLTMLLLVMMARRRSRGMRRL